MGEIYSLQHSRAFNAIYFLECFHSFQGSETHTWWNSVKQLEKVSAFNNTFIGSFRTSNDSHNVDNPGF